ncbi:hypothetical protein SAMD00019534_084920, partial [Acytostelium subglobosum LB1]|uniref:hypothetical protein n=1 Tax=Acytostelium subglobosum LB1 TaxID=1410327 RepID=UPI00064501A9
MQALLLQKTQLENELEQLMEYLTKGEGSLFGLRGSFVDSEGFPSPQLDVIIEVKKSRARVACIQNDYKALMARIESDFYKLHASYKASPSASTSTPTTTPSTSAPTTKASPPSQPQTQTTQTQTQPQSPPAKKAEDDVVGVPFVYIDMVSSGSPADRSGLQKNDKIYQFGSIGPLAQLDPSVQYLQTMATIVRNSENSPITLKYTRDGEKKTTTLTPKKWTGQGLIGCLMKPMTL